ncbi:MAG: metallophosphoesterase [Candidatus Woesearchaeota archaeon]|nr:metallophosphoesterase [Candidatus Woesearchaeota archaeon]
MKLFAFGDTHGNSRFMHIVVSKIKKEKPNLILCAGDLSVFENGLEKTLKALDELKILTLVIHGNHESENALGHLCSKLKHVKFFHKRGLKMGNYFFFGFGGGGFSMVDKEFERTAKKFKKTIKDEKVVLMTHAPPYRTKLDRISGMHHGSKSISHFIREIKPVLVICGHLHENSGKHDRIGKTFVINPGPMGKVIKI